MDLAQDRDKRAGFDDSGIEPSGSLKWGEFH